MDLYTINYIKNNELIYRYLREDSSWYKYLNRNYDVLKQIEEKAKEYYKLRPEDKIIKIKDNIDMVSKFLEVLKE